MGTVPSSQPSLALITMKIILSVCLSIALTAAFPADKVTPEKVDDDSFIEEQGKFGYGYSHHQPGSHHHVSFYQQDPQHHSYNHESYKPKCETVYETSYTTVTEQKCSTPYETKCETSYEEECETSYKELCFGHGFKRKCEKIPQRSCTEVPVKKPVSHCNKVPKEHCDEVPVQQPVEKCEKVPKEDCNKYPVEICDLVPVEKPIKVSKKVCHSHVSHH